MTSEMYRLVLQYVAERRARREITAATAIRQRTALIGFAVHYGQRPARNLSQRDIERWMETRAPLISAGTRRYEWTTTRNFCRWLVTRKVIRRDPFLELRAPRVPRAVPRALPRADIDRLRAVLPDRRAEAIVSLMVGLGLRLSEVCSLEAGDYDQAARTLLVRHGKGGHQRLLPVPSDVARDLDRYLAAEPASAGDALVRRRHPTPGPIGAKRVGRLMREWMEEAGVKAAPGDGRACHSLRHTLASEVAESGAPLPVLQQILGHQSLTSTQVYLRRAELRRVREALEHAAGNAREAAKGSPLTASSSL